MIRSLNSLVVSKIKIKTLLSKNFRALKNEKTSKEQSCYKYTQHPARQEGFVLILQSWPVPDREKNVLLEAGK